MRREEAKVEIKRRTRARLTKLERPPQTGHPCLLLGILDMLVPVREENITVHEHLISLLGTVRTNSHYSSLISHVLRSQCRTKDAARFVDHGYYIFFFWPFATGASRRSVATCRPDNWRPRNAARVPLLLRRVRRVGLSTLSPRPAVLSRRELCLAVYTTPTQSFR